MHEIDETRPTLSAIFDALTGSSADGCDPDWCRAVLDRADPKNVAMVRAALSSGLTEEETARQLGIRCPAIGYISFT